MPTLKKEITICMGSSCFSRGNKRTLPLIQSYLKHHHLEEEVVLKGNHCFSRCSEGPVLKIEGRIYTQVSGDRITEIMEAGFGTLKPKEDGSPAQHQQ
ncbi:MAG: NAD(P)H-dependent oxidoreductase subunit E [Bacteroidales bacterium]